MRQVYPGVHVELEVELEMLDGEVERDNEEEVEVKEVEREKRSDTRVKHVDDTRRHSNLSQNVQQLCVRRQARLKKTEKQLRAQVSLCLCLRSVKFLVVLCRFAVAFLLR